MTMVKLSLALSGGMDFCGSRCLSGVKTVGNFAGHVLPSAYQWHCTVVMGSKHPEVHMCIHSIKLYYMYTSLIPSKSCWAYYQCAQCWHSVYVNIPSAVGNHHSPSIMWTACVFNVSLEIQGSLANPVWAKTTSMSHSSENICLNTKWETTYRLLGDYRETLKEYRSQSISC